MTNFAPRPRVRDYPGFQIPYLDLLLKAILVRWGILALSIILSVRPAFGLEPREIFDRWAAAVVTVEGPLGLGSGFVIAPGGEVVTNHHVVSGQRWLEVILLDGERRPVIAVLHQDPERDLAILNVNTRGLPRIVLGDSNSVHPGDRVVAIGNPQGFQNTITEGIISQIRTAGGITLLQTQTPISPGSSGGPLFNNQGEVIGISVGTWGEGQNLNFAIAVNELKRVLGQPIPTSPKTALGTRPTTPPTSTPSAGAGAVQLRGRDHAEMVYIPTGTFTMGDTQTGRITGGDSDEGPAHPASLEAFWLDRTEVTNTQFARFVQASGYRAKGDWQEYATGKDKHPVVEVTWHDALAYCRWAEKRLPSEAEWEYAARGTDGRTYPWGKAWDASRARFSGNNGNQTTAPAGSYPTGASPFGVLDLAGNVWEWVSSLYKPYPYAPTDGREDLTIAGWRVFRGGSWSTHQWNLRSLNRDGYYPVNHSTDIGFRCAQHP